MNAQVYLLATTLDFIGKFLLALLVILVHYKVQRAGKIDSKVLKEMKLEKIVGTVALILVVIAYIFHLAAYFS